MFCENAEKRDITVGIYAYNLVTKNNSNGLEDFKEKQREFAENTLKYISNKKISLPIYLDIEDQSIEGSYDSEHLNAMLNIWYETFSQNGYIPGIYTNKSRLETIYSMVDKDLFNKFELWLSGGPKYTREGSEIKYVDDIKAFNCKDFYGQNFEFSPNVNQVTNCCSDAGAGNPYGCVDVSYTKLKPIEKNYNLHYRHLVQLLF